MLRKLIVTTFTLIIHDNIPISCKGHMILIIYKNRIIITQYICKYMIYKDYYLLNLTNLYIISLLQASNISFYDVLILF